MKIQFRRYEFIPVGSFAPGNEAMPPSVGSVAGKSVGSVGGNQLASLPVVGWLYWWNMKKSRAVMLPYGNNHLLINSFRFRFYINFSKSSTGIGLEK